MNHNSLELQLQRIRDSLLVSLGKYTHVYTQRSILIHKLNNKTNLSDLFGMKIFLVLNLSLRPTKAVVGCAVIFINHGYLMLLISCLISNHTIAQEPKNLHEIPQEEIIRYSYTSCSRTMKFWKIYM